MVNIVTVTPRQARKDAILYIRVQEFRNRNFDKGDKAHANIGGHQFTLFTAARHLVTAEPDFIRYASSLTQPERDVLYAEALGQKQANGKARPGEPLVERNLQ
jgi:hypothetical protein